MEIPTSCILRSTTTVHDPRVTDMHPRQEVLCTRSWFKDPEACTTRTTTQDIQTGSQLLHMQAHGAIRCRLLWLHLILEAPAGPCIEPQSSKNKPRFPFSHWSVSFLTVIPHVNKLFTYRNLDHNHLGADSIIFTRADTIGLCRQVWEFRAP